MRPGAGYAPPSMRTASFSIPSILVLLFAAGCADTRGYHHYDAGHPAGDGGCGLQSECNGYCVDLLNDSANCGGCGLACALGQSCLSGLCDTCTPSCDGLSCGDDGCGGSCGSCPAGQSCGGGFCAMAGGGESCSSATLVTASGSFAFSFTGHVADHTPFSCGSTGGQPDVAFRVTAINSGTATFETSGSIDTVMAVFSSPTCDSTAELTCDDDGGTSTNALVQLDVTAGTTYYVVVAAYGSSTPSGSSTLTVTLP